MGLQHGSISDSLVSGRPYGSPHTGISSSPMPIKDEPSIAFVSFQIVKKPIRGALDPLDRVCLVSLGGPLRRGGPVRLGLH